MTKEESDALAIAGMKVIVGASKDCLALTVVITHGPEEEIGISMSANVPINAQIVMLRAALAHLNDSPHGYMVSIDKPKD